jgi:subtilisin family serine protease
VLATYPELGLQHLKLPSEESVVSIIRKIQGRCIVEIAEPNFKAYILSTPQPPPPDDPEWINGALWGMVKIGMKGIWDKGLVGGEIIVAVIDTGIDYDHPDLIHPNHETNLWENPSETLNNNDDDLNNFIDDIYGPNYCSNGRTNGDPKDDHGHGTLVAGTIAAVGNNTMHVTGVSWKAKIMSVKSFCYDGIGNTGAIIAGIYYAVNMGATIISNSWSLGGVNHQNLKTAIEYANQHNVLFVAAAGNINNDNDTNPQYPASYVIDNVMAVAATDETDHRWVESVSEGSNWGATSVHIAAPGHFIESLVPLYLDPYGISLANGTSMAAPHVAGCAVLLQSKRLATSSPSPKKKLGAKKAAPELLGKKLTALTHLPPKDLKNALMDAADKVPNLPVSVDADGYGRRLNCYNAAYPADGTPPAAPTNLKVQ